MRKYTMKNEMTNMMKKIPNDYSKAMLLKLKTIIAIGALISLTAFSSYTSNLSDSGLESPSYPVVHF